MKTLLLQLTLLTVCTAGYGQAADLNTEVEQALKKTSGYFSSLGTDAERRDVVMLLFILQEHFNHPLGLLPLYKYKERDPELNASYFMLYDTYFDGKNKPQADDNTVRNYLKNNLNTTDGLTVWSMFCNNYPLPDNFVKILDERTEEGEYAMTHAAMQLGNILNLECVKPGAATDNLRNKLVKKLTAEINAGTEYFNSSDMRFECMAMLYYLGQGHQVKEENIRFILQQQLGNGGWASAPTVDQVANVHTSLMALWVLLEYQHRKI